MSLPNERVLYERIERREQIGSRSDNQFLGRDATSQFAKVSVRRDTFKDPWPQELQNLAELLAIEGFFYLGTDKNVRCFCCGLLLGDWESDDEPWKIHTKHRKDCTFLRSRHGEAIDARDRDTEQKREMKKLKSLLEKSESRRLLQEKQLKKKNEEIEQLNGYARSLVEEIEILVKEIDRLKRQRLKEGNEMNDYIASLSKENDTLRKEGYQNIQKEEEVMLYDRKSDISQAEVPHGFLTTRKPMKNNENDAVIQELSHYATCLKTEVEYLRKENRKLQQQVLKLTERFDLETYFLKGVLREKHSRIAVLNDLLHRAKAEKEKFETEKANVVQILKKQQQVFQAKNGRILQLEEELGRNRDAQEACVGFGYSREDVSEAVLVWGRINPGYKAEDLMKILIERNREWHEGVVTEENQMETEGAVGGQDEL